MIYDKKSEMSTPITAEVKCRFVIHSTYLFAVICPIFFLIEYIKCFSEI